MKKIDLHIHSNFSDGDDSIPLIIEKLKKKKIELFSITDHDSLESINTLNSIPNINYINGVEMSAKLENIKMHILGYGVKANGSLSIECNNIKKLRRELVYEIMKDLQKRGYVFTDEDLESIYNNTSSCIGKVDISKLLFKKNYAKSINDAFNEILGKYKIGPKIRIDAEKVISLINEDDGIAILAHPFEIIKKQDVDLYKVINRLIEMKINGLEAYTTKHNDFETKEIIKICNERNLLITGGSDYHGISKPNIELCEYLGGEISERVKKKAIKH